jgi:hypothetical protein
MPDHVETIAKRTLLWMIIRALMPIFWASWPLSRLTRAIRGGPTFFAAVGEFQGKSFVPSAQIHRSWRAQKIRT